MTVEDRVRMEALERKRDEGTIEPGEMYALAGYYRHDGRKDLADMATAAATAMLDAAAAKAQAPPTPAAVVAPSGNAAMSGAMAGCVAGSIMANPGGVGCAALIVLAMIWGAVDEAWKTTFPPPPPRITVYPPKAWMKPGILGSSFYTVRVWVHNGGEKTRDGVKVKVYAHRNGSIVADNSATLPSIPAGQRVQYDVEFYNLNTAPFPDQATAELSDPGREQ